LRDEQSVRAGSNLNRSILGLSEIVLAGTEKG